MLIYVCVFVYIYITLYIHIDIYVYTHIYTYCFFYVIWKYKTRMKRPSVAVTLLCKAPHMPHRLNPEWLNDHE